MSSEIWLTDMSRCVPKHALSAKRRRYHWQMIDYEAEGGLRGVMVSAGPETEAPDIIYPLDVKGWYGIYIGIWGLGSENEEMKSMVKVRLKDDPCFTIFTREKPSFGTIEEGFWKYADLTGQHIIIGQQRSGFRASASLAYIRLVHLTEEEVKKIKRDQAREDVKRLIAANDAFSDLFNKRPTSKENIIEMVEPYRNTDFRKLFWEVGYGRTSLGSRIGTLIGEECEDYPRTGDRYIAEGLQILTSKGIDPLQIAMEHAHSIGLEFHVSQRIEAFQMAPPWEEFFTTKFYREHTEFRLIDKDGTEITGLSYTYLEVREYYISVLKEAAEYGADGAVVIFVRGPPIILYEKPVVEGFEKKYGIDPREIAETDERWLSYKAGFITQFMREVRQAMDKVGKKLNKNLEVSAIIMATKEQNLFFGLDVEAWVKEELVDNLIPYPWDGKDVDMIFFTKITKGSRCKVYPNIMPRRMPPEDFRRKALAYYEAGADGLFFWDTNARHDTTSMWETIRRLGHIEELKAQAKEKKPREEPRIIKLMKLGGYTMQKYSPYRGG